MLLYKHVFFSYSKTSNLKKNNNVYHIRFNTMGNNKHGSTLYAFGDHNNNIREYTLRSSFRKAILKSTDDR